MFRSLRVVMFWLSALALSACQVQGHPQEVPASYPDSAEPPTEQLDPAPEQLDRAPETLEPVPERLDAERSQVAPRTSSAGTAKSTGQSDFNVPLWDDSTGSTHQAPVGIKRSPASASNSTDREAETRPGLATHWGETRESPSQRVEFVRASATHPAHVAQIHYNDRSGALEMLPDGNWTTSEVSLRRGALELSMVDESGRPFPALRRGDRVVALGDPGERYALRIENHSGERFEVVASVDGLDVLDGEVGSVQKRGYLVAAHGSVVIDGFRRSQNDVAAFRLGDVAHSYANSKGKARNVGVIGFALFEEQRPVVTYAQPPHAPRYSHDTRLRQSAEAFPGGYAQPPAW
jgi:hypothetical protein